MRSVMRGAWCLIATVGPVISVHAAALPMAAGSPADMPQVSATYDRPLMMVLLVLAFVTMAAAGRAVRRRTVKDIIAAQVRRRNY